jgi:peptidyl-prolyl cis-trans isomerase SurA
MQRQILRLVLPSLLIASPARAEILERVVAKVNGDIVTLSDFQSRQVAAAQAARVSTAQVEGFLRKNNAKILQDAVDELLLTQRAAELEMRLRPEVVRDVVEGIKKENNLETDADLAEQLRREGMSMDDLRRSVERSMVRRMVLQREIEPKVTVSEQEGYADYQARKNDYVKPATVKLQEIFVKGDDAQTKAQTLLERIRAGEDFSAVARAVSEAPSARNGGDLGTLAQGDMNPTLEKEAFALDAGAVSEPLPHGEGYRILKVVEKTERSVVPYEEAKDEIRQRLQDQKIQKEYQVYMDALREKAIVAILVREVPLQLTGPVPDNALLDTPLLGGSVEPAGPESPAVEPVGPRAPAGLVIPEAVPPPAADSEFTTTPQARPERVAPPPLPEGAEPKEKPEDKKDERREEKPPAP